MSWQITLFYSLFILVTIYLMICAGYLFLHRYFIIFPSRKLPKVPSDFKMQYEEVYFSTTDRVLLNGWLIKGDTGKEWKEFTVILFPGNKGSMSDFLIQMSQLKEIGFNIFLFSYRGFGKSQKKWPTEDGVYKDSEAAFRYLAEKKKIHAEKTVFLGQSLGCAMASRTAREFNPHALILEGGFPSLAEPASRSVPWLPLKILTRSGFETSRFLAGTRCPVLIIHSQDDKAIPLSNAEDLFNSVKVKKKKVIISGPHAKGLEHDSKNYLEEIEKFLGEISGQGANSVEALNLKR